MLLITYEIQHGKRRRHHLPRTRHKPHHLYTLLEKATQFSLQSHMENYIGPCSSFRQAVFITRTAPTLPTDSSFGRRQSHLQKLRLYTKQVYYVYTAVCHRPKLPSPARHEGGVACKPCRRRKSPSEGTTERWFPSNVLHIGQVTI